MKKLLICSILLLSGCSEEFKPNGEYKQRLIVYAAIDASSATQLIRVYSTFSPEVYNPLVPSPNTEIANAFVQIKEGNSTYLFHDTLVTVNNGASGTRQVRAYINKAFQPEEDKIYSLKVHSSGFDTAKSSMTGISRGDLLPGNTALFSKPATEKYIALKVALGRNAHAYLAKISLEYIVGTDTLIREVPFAVMKDEFGHVLQRYYPKITFRDASSNITGNYETISFETAAYIAAVADIRKENSTTVKFRRAILTLIQFDNNLYTYYSITNSFGGASTIRLDEPDYTNISNGFGVYGMMTKEERSYGITGDL